MMLDARSNAVVVAELVMKTPFARQNARTMCAAGASLPKKERNG